MENKTPEQLDIENESKPLAKFDSRLKCASKLTSSDKVLMRYLVKHKTSEPKNESLSWVHTSVVARDTGIDQNKVLELLGKLSTFGAVYRSALSANVFMAKYKI